MTCDTPECEATIFAKTHDRFDKKAEKDVIYQGEENGWKVRKKRSDDTLFFRCPYHHTREKEKSDPTPGTDYITRTELINAMNEGWRTLHNISSLGFPAIIKPVLASYEDIINELRNRQDNE